MSGEIGVQADNKVVALDVPGTVAARFNENGSRDTGYVDPGKVKLPVVVAIDMAIAPDGSATAALTIPNFAFLRGLRLFATGLTLAPSGYPAVRNIFPEPVEVLIQ